MGAVLMVMVTPLDSSMTPKQSLRYLLCHAARAGMVVSKLCIHSIPFPKFNSFHRGNKVPGAPEQLPVPFSSPGLGTMWGGQLYPRGSDSWVQSLLHGRHYLCPAPLQSQHPRDPRGAVWGSPILNNHSGSQTPSDLPRTWCPTALWNPTCPLCLHIPLCLARVSEQA